MKKSLLSNVSVRLLCAAMILLAAGCRSTPVSPPPETQRTEPESKISPEMAKPPEAPPVTASKTQKEIIARLLPESLVASPARDLAARRVEYNTVLKNRPSEPLRNSSWRYRTTRQGQVVGFEFSNHGGNRILPPHRDPVRNQFFARDFQFRFDERARQDIHLMVSDWVPSRDRLFRLSELMNSLMLFFPRTFLPAIVNWKTRNIVTLPTGEEVDFDAQSHEIVAGVLSETPVDLNPDRSTRMFPGVEYNGKGVAIRANSRGADPRMGTTTLITTGTPAKDCDKGILCGQCEVKPQDLWDQLGAARFKYASDADFDRFLIARCGFGLPRIGTDFAIATSANNR
ncbi:MAG: hypothetical protein ACREP3_08680 [Candidatus Binatia bacterium]